MSNLDTWDCVFACQFGSVWEAPNIGTSRLLSEPRTTVHGELVPSMVFCSATTPYITCVLNLNKIQWCFQSQIHYVPLSPAVDAVAATFKELVKDQIHPNSCKVCMWTIVKCPRLHIGTNQR